IRLKTPFVSSPMDTVTGAEMAILMALFGGIGILHFNYSSLEEQLEAVEKVKRFEAGFVFRPVILSPKHTIQDVYRINEKYGFFSVPITEDGTLKSKLVGIVTHRDIRYREDMNTSLKKIMTPRHRLVVARKEDTVDRNDLEFANKIIRRHNLDTLPIVDQQDKVVALVTDSDLKKNQLFPLATKNQNKQLRVFIAVESRLALAKKRIGPAWETGVDGIVIDAGIAFREQIDIARYCQKNFPDLQVVLGNVDSGEMVRTIIKEASNCCHALRVGVGPGRACITQQHLGTGRAQASAVLDCAQAARQMEKEYGLMPIIADGGIRILDIPEEKLAKKLGEIAEKSEVFRPGDISKALALGANTVMMGSILAGLDEAPGEREFDEEENRMVKKYRGMGSLEAMEKRSAVRYGQDKSTIRVPEGRVIKVPYRGSGYVFLPELIAGVKQSLQKQAFRTIEELQREADIRPI
ncbi:MAG: IMP dehydrogenase, partial [Candidatus Omnitrophica bacterium]|nr:IMP dehydrogenase [Candidatus Omnitrophota bacterium]